MNEAIDNIRKMLSEGHNFREISKNREKVRKMEKSEQRYVILETAGGMTPALMDKAQIDGLSAYQYTTPTKRYTRIVGTRRPDGTWNNERYGETHPEPFSIYGTVDGTHIYASLEDAEEDINRLEEENAEERRRVQAAIDDVAMTKKRIVELKKMLIGTEIETDDGSDDDDIYQNQSFAQGQRSIHKIRSELANLSLPLNSEEYDALWVQAQEGSHHQNLPEQQYNATYRIIEAIENYLAKVDEKIEIKEA